MEIAFRLMMAEIDNTIETGEEFIIEFVKKTTGELKKMRATKTKKSPQYPSTQKKSSGNRKLHSIKDNREIFLFDLDEEIQKVIKKDLVVKFNNLNVIY